MSSPYIDKNTLIKKIKDFINIHKTLFLDNQSRMSDYFEMSVYNDVVQSYKNNGYKIKIKNLSKGNVFRYKLSPSGLAENFSYFILNKNNNDVEVHHNISTSSFHDENLSYTPDISVTSLDGVNTRKRNNGTRYSFIEKSNLITFFEVKNRNSYAELLFSFIGLVNEITPEFLENHLYQSDNGEHCAPSLVLSGVSSHQADIIKESLEKRYYINIITDLYYGQSIADRISSLKLFEHRKNT
jgi:hypothetical protein